MAERRATGSGGEHGGALTEYAVVLLIIAMLTATVVVAVPSSGSGLSEALARAACQIMGGEDCGGADSEDGTDLAEPDPNDPCGLFVPVPPQSGREAEQAERRDEAALDQVPEHSSALADIIDGDWGRGKPEGFVDPLSPSPLPEHGIVGRDTASVAEDYPDLVAFFAENSHLLDNQAYAAELVNTLGPDDVRSLIDRANIYGATLFAEDALAEHAGDANAVYDDYLRPLATLLAAADRSGRMDPAVREALVSTGPPSEEEVLANLADPEYFEAVTGGGGIPEDDYDLIAWNFWLGQQRANAVLLHEGDFTAQTTADMAADILALDAPRPILDAIERKEAFRHPEFFEEGDHPDHLADSRWLALQALAEDPNAATLFYRDPDNAQLADFWTDEDNYPQAYTSFVANTDWSLGMGRDALISAMIDSADAAWSARCD